MKTNKITRLQLLRSQRIILPLIIIAVLLFVVSLSSAGKPVYAASATPQQIVSGGGPGVGGGGGSPPPQIMGQIFNAQTGGYAANVTVCLYDEYWNIGAFLGSTTTDSQGNFDFSFGEILANGEYLITINGYKSDLGTSAIDPSWCQYESYVWTNSGSQGLMGRLSLPPSAVVNVTYAALYSNTQYATLYYGTESVHTVEHSLSFNVPVLGIGTGYTTSISATYSSTFWTAPLHSEIIYSPYYAASYFDGTQGKLVSAGIVEPALGYPSGSMSTNEYVTPQNANPAYTALYTVAPGGAEFDYMESGSWTWQASVVPFGIIFQEWSQVISVDVTVTVTQEWTQWVRTVFTNPTNSNLEFLVHGAQPTPNGFGGMELHVWDMSGDG